MKHYKLSPANNRPNDLKNHILSILKTSLLKSIKNVNNNFNGNSYYGFIGIVLLMIQITIFLWNLILWPYNINNIDKDVLNIAQNFQYSIKSFRFIYSIDQSIIPFYYAYSLAFLYVMILFSFFFLTIYTEKKIPNKLFAFFGYFHRFFAFFTCQYIFMKATFCNFNEVELFSTIHIILMTIGIIGATINLALAILTNDYYFKGFLNDNLASFNHKKTSQFIHMLGIIAIISNLSQNYITYIKGVIATLILSLSMLRLYVFSRYFIYLNLNMTKLRVFESLYYINICIIIYCSLIIDINSIDFLSNIMLLILGTIIILTKIIYQWIEGHKYKLYSKKIEDLINDLEAIQHFYAFQSLTLYGMGNIEEPGLKDIRRIIINGIMVAHYKTCKDINCLCNYTNYIKRKNKPENDLYEKSPLYFSLDPESIENFSKFLLECYIKRFPNSNDIKLLTVQYYMNSSRLSHKGYMLLEKLENHKDIEFYIELRLKLLGDQYHEKILNDIEDTNNDGLYIKNMIIYTELQEEFILLLENQLYNMQKFWNELLNSEVLIKNLYIIGNEIFQNEGTIEKYWDQILILVNKRIELPYLIYGLYKAIACNSTSMADDLLCTYRNILGHVMSINNDVINNEPHTLYSKNSMYFICSGEIKTIGNILLCSENVMNLIGYNKEELIGKSLEILVPNIYRNFHTEIMIDFSNSDKLDISHDNKFLFYLNRNDIINPCKIHIKLDHHIKYGMILLGVVKLIKTNTQYILVDINGNIDSATKDITNELYLGRKTKYNNNLSKSLNIEQFCTKFEEINRICNTVIKTNQLYLGKDKDNQTNTSNNNDNDNNQYSLYNQLSLYEYEKFNEYYKMLNEGIELKFHSRIINKRSTIYHKITKKTLNKPTSMKTISYLVKINDRIYKNNNIIRIIELSKPHSSLQTQISFAKSSKNKDKSILDCIVEEYPDDVILSNSRGKHYYDNIDQNKIKNKQNHNIFDSLPLNTKSDNIKFTHRTQTQTQTQFQTYTTMNLETNDYYKNNTEITQNNDYYKDNTEIVQKLDTSPFDNEKIIGMKHNICENINADEGTIDQINNFYKINIKDYSYSKDSELIKFNSTSPNLSFSFNNVNNENIIADKDHHKHTLIKNNHEYESYKKLVANDDNQYNIEHPDSITENKSEIIPTITNITNIESSINTKQYIETYQTIKPSSSSILKQSKRSLLKIKAIESKIKNKLNNRTKNLRSLLKQNRRLSMQVTNDDLQIEQSIGTGSTHKKKHVQQTVEKAVMSSYYSKYVKYMRILCFVSIFFNLGISTESCIIQNNYINSIDDSMKSIQSTYKQLDYIVEMNRRTRMLLLLEEGLFNNDRHVIDGIPDYSAYCASKMGQVNNGLKDVTNLMERFLYTSMESPYRNQIVKESIKVYWNSTIYLDKEDDLLFFDALRTLISEAYNVYYHFSNQEINNNDEYDASVIFILKNTLNGYLISLSEVSKIFQIAIENNLFDIKINMYINVGIGMFLAIIFLILFSISIIRLIKEKIIIFKRIVTINHTKIRLIIERLNLLRTFIKSTNKNHILVDQVLQSKNDIEYKFNSIDNINNKKSKNSILNTKDFYEKCWTIGLKIFLIGIFVSWYYIFIMIIFTIYEQNCRLVTSKINKTYSILTKQGLQMSMAYEFISENNTFVENQPILDIIDDLLLHGALYNDVLNIFEDENFQIDSIRKILYGNLCYTQTNDAISKRCGNLGNGICTKGLLSLTAYIEGILNEMISKYLLSRQTLEIRRELLQSQTLIDLEILFYFYSRTGYNNILTILNNIFDNITNKLLTIQLIILMVYILSILIIALILTNPLLKKLKEENISLKKFLRLIPTNIIINNKNLSTYLIDTSPNFFNLNRLT